MIERRAYQTRAVKHAAGLKPGSRVLYVGPTGSGKRVIAVLIILRHLRKGGRVLFLAGRRTLIDQAYKELIKHGIPERDVGVIMNADEKANGGRERVRPDARVQVAGAATLIRREMPPATLVIVDEAHHVVANSYRKILAGYPEATVLGFTATPNRMDGTGLREVFSELFVIAQPPELIALGKLAEPHVYGAPKSAGDLRKLRMRGLRLSGGDYSPKKLGEAMNHRTLVGNIINEWMRLAGGKATVVFASSVEHSREICRRFNAAGIKAEHIDMDTSEDERAAILKRLDTGETKVACNYDVLTEGWDQPRVRCLVLARPKRSETVCIQQAGRVMRVFGNQRAIILDHAGNFFRFKLPHEERAHSLDSAGRAGGGDAEPNKQCPGCGVIMPLSAAMCHECGHVFVREVSKGEHDQKLARIESAKLLSRVRELAKSRGIGEEWVRSVASVTGSA